MRLFEHSGSLLSEQALTDLGWKRLLTKVLGEEAEVLGEYLCALPAAAERETRREFFRDILRNEEAQAFLRKIVTDAHEPEKLAALYGKDRRRDAMYWFRYVQAYIAAVESLAEVTFSEENRQSKRFRELVLRIRGERDSAPFAQLRERLQALMTALAPFYRTTVWLEVTNGVYTASAVLPDETTPTVTHRVCAAMQRFFSEVPVREPRAASLLQTDAFLRILCEREASLTEIRNTLVQTAQTYAFVRFDVLLRDIRVVWCVLRLVRYLRECHIPLCEAIVEDDGTFAITQGTDISLLDRESRVIPNDYHETKPIALLHGINSGGKTAFMRMVGICTSLAMVGLPVPAQAMRCPPIGTIRTVFTARESKEQGRLIAERAALAKAFEGMGPRTLLLVNEMFSSTNEQDAVSLSQKALAAVRAAGAYGIWNTHHRLPLTAIDDVCALYTPLTDESGQRRFILRKQASVAANAADIVRRYGLQKEQLTVRLQKRGLL